MTSKPTSELVTHILHLGADYIVMKPNFAAQLMKRIEDSVNERKPFVVTSDYVGLSRWKGAAATIPTQIIDVPQFAEKQCAWPESGIL